MEINAKCAARHLGPWMMEPSRFRAAFSAVKDGSWKPETEPRRANMDEESGRTENGRLLYAIEDGIAVVPIIGPLIKGGSKFGGTDSVLARRAVNKAAADREVKKIILLIDSPGGTADGTHELARAVKQADAIKPVYAHIDDMGASAAYWVASQARRITANPTAQVGSIGTVVVLEDTSKAFDMAGVKVHVIASGKMKGALNDGVEITNETLEYVQKLVDDLNAFFLDGVLDGRAGKLTRASLMEIADGRTFLAMEAKKLGLIDSIQFWSDVVGQARSAGLRRPSQLTRYRIGQLTGE